MLTTTAYTRNRCNQRRTDSTPYEMFTGKRPNIGHMAPFGSKCFVYDDNYKRKLDVRAYQGVLWGMIVIRQHI